MQYQRAISIRDDIALYCERNQFEMELWFKKAFNSDNPKRAAQSIPDGVRLCTPYYWSDQMMKTCMECAITLPRDASFRVEDLPTEDGFFAFDHMVRMYLEIGDGTEEKLLLIAFNWIRVPDKVLFMIWLCDEANGRVPYPIFFRSQAGEPVISLNNITTSEVGAHATLAGFSLFCTMILFMNQKIVTHEARLLDRATRKRMKNKHATVRVVYLRKRASQHNNNLEGEHRNVEWDHSWVVRGHWRNQYYRSTKENRPLFIQPYVKGPSDKPLVHSEKLFAVVR